MKRIWAVAVIALVAVGGAACSKAAGTPKADPTTTTTTTTTPLPTTTTSLPFNQIAPITNPAVGASATSEHWAGYTFDSNGVTGVRAEWTEPDVKGNPSDEEYVWIGIGGWGVPNLIQIGTYAIFPPDGGGTMNEGVWYEEVPGGPAQYPGFAAVSPGDQIYASITSVAQTPDDWLVELSDVSNFVTFSEVIHFPSNQSYPSFVVEDPNAGPPSAVGPFTPFASWESVTFTNMQVRIGANWVPAAALPAIRIAMVRDGVTLASADPLTPQSSFEATQP